MKMRLVFLICALMIVFSGAVSLCMADAPEPYEKKKQTVLKKYVTAQEAYVRWHQEPDAIHIIDCRTPEEYAYVGHAPMARNIPSKLGEWDTMQGKMVTRDNPHFEKIIQERFKKTDILIVMCRSGSRSSESVNRLAAIGFQNVYTIIDGFEGDMVKDRQSAYKGKRMRNGWKNALAPWTYESEPDLVYTLPVPAE